MMEQLFLFSSFFFASGSGPDGAGDSRDDAVEKCALATAAPAATKRFFEYMCFLTDEGTLTVNKNWIISLTGDTLVTMQSHTHS